VDSNLCSLVAWCCFRQPCKDITNKPNNGTTKAAKPKKKTGKKAPKPISPDVECPHFSSFDSYELVVQPVTPIKTAICSGASSASWSWDPEQFKNNEYHSSQLCSPVAESLPQSSPLDRPLRPITRSVSGSGNRFVSAVAGLSMETRRAKRIRERLCDTSHEAVSTSTPDHIRKQSR